MSVPFANLIRHLHQSARPAPVDPQTQYWRNRALSAEHDYMLEYSRRSRAYAMLSSVIYQRDMLLKNVHAGLIRGPLAPQAIAKIDEMGVDRYHHTMRKYGFTRRDADGNYVVQGQYLAHGTAEPLRLKVKPFMAVLEKFRKSRLARKTAA